MKVAILIADSNGSYPVPAVKGGAVATLVEHLVEMNDLKQLIDMEIISFCDSEAVEQSAKYPNITFRWIKVPRLFKLLDQIIYSSIRVFFRKKKAISYKSISSLVYYIWKASRIIKKNPYDKLVLENNIPLAWTIKLSRYPGEYFYHFHNIPRINAKAKEVFHNCTGYLCVSQYVAEQISISENPVGPVSRERLKILYNCINVDYFKPDYSARSEIRTRYNLSETDKVLLFVGRMSAEKGIDKLLEAAKRVQNKVKVLIVGSYIHNAESKDDYLIYLHKLAESLGNRVIFTGYISQDEVAKVYNAADIAVLPSMWDEPAGLTMIEAMVSGIPVITTASGGIPEYAGECSIVLQRDKDLIKNIAESIDGLLDGTIEYPTERAKHRIYDNFSLDNYLERFCECLL